MVEAINGLIDSLMGSPWAYLVIFAVCMIDAFFPVVPSETTVIAASVVAASGGKSLPMIIILAAVGAFCGDHVSYSIGRFLGTRAVNKLLSGEKGLAARRWAENALRVRGGLMIVAFRFIPGGRTAMTLTAGTLEYPLVRFSPFVALGAVLWALYGALIGFWAGELFAGNHLLAVTLGIGLSVTMSGVVEIIRYFVRRRRRHSGPQPPAGDDMDGEADHRLGSRTQ